MLSNLRHLFSILIVSLWTLHFAAASATAQVASGIDLVELRDLAGITNVDGNGVNLLHVEAGSAVRDEDDNIISFSYSPDSDNSQLNSKTFSDVGTPGQTSSGTNGHARSVGFNIYGSTLGTAPGVGEAGSPSIKIQGASDFINNQLGTLVGTFGGQYIGDPPPTQTVDVSNHSYVSSLALATGFDPDFALDRLNRLDHIINESDMTMVIGTSNRGNGNGDHPVGFVHAYNVITAGVTDGTNPGATTTFNGTGRNAVHVVVDHNFTSNATGHVSGAASILHQTGAGTDAVKQEVIKATILAGATKDDLLDSNREPVAWTPTTNPLDNRYGAGELNVLNNHLIQQGGEFNGSANPSNAQTADFNGWDYEENLAANQERFYEFTVVEGNELEGFSIALTWNLNTQIVNVIQGFVAVEANELANLSLELIDVSDNSTIASSNSSVDNVEHIFHSSLTSGTYRLRVANGSTNVGTDYGLAFRGTVVDAVLLGDCNLDGVVDFFDIGPLIGFMTSSVYLEQADCNQDGVVDFFDIAAFLGILSRS